LTARLAILACVCVFLGGSCTCGMDLSGDTFACSQDSDCAPPARCVQGICGSGVDGGGTTDSGMAGMGDAGGSDAGGDAGGLNDGGAPDGGTADGGAADGGSPVDGGAPDSGPSPDAGASDAGPTGFVLVQHTACVGAPATTTSTVTCVLPDVSQAGDLLLVTGGWSPSTDLPNLPSDSQDNTFTLVGQAGTDQLVILYYAQDIAGGTRDSVTWSVSGETPLSLELAEFSGASRTAAYTGRFQAATGTSATPNSGGIVPPGSGSLIFGAMAHDGMFTSDAGPGFILLDVATDDAMDLNPAIDEYLLSGGISISISATFVLSGSAPWGALVAGFVPAP
jgi:hypothetical protein